MPVAAVIPIRSFRGGKDRLSHHLSPEQRQQLGQGLSNRVVVSSEAAGLIPTVVTSDAEVAGWAGSMGIAVVPETGPGLNAAATAGMEWAESVGLQWAIVHSDLPLITESDLEVVEAIARSGQSVIAPSSDGGTSVLSSPSPVEFGYGPGSFHWHLPRLSSPNVVYRKGLAHDLDTSDDLVSVMSDEDGEWVSRIVDSVERVGQEVPKI